MNPVIYIATMVALVLLFGLAGFAMTIRSAVKNKPRKDWVCAVELRYSLPYTLPMSGLLAIITGFAALPIAALLAYLFPTYVEEAFPVFLVYEMGGFLLVSFFSPIVEQTLKACWIKRITH